MTVTNTELEGQVFVDTTYSQAAELVRLAISRREETIHETC